MQCWSNDERIHIAASLLKYSAKSIYKSDNQCSGNLLSNFSYLDKLKEIMSPERPTTLGPDLLANYSQPVSTLTTIHIHLQCHYAYIGMRSLD